MGMQTTLRMDDHLIRKAKAEASRQGISLTRFIEESIRLRLVDINMPVPDVGSESLPSAELVPNPGLKLDTSRDIWELLTAADLTEGRIPSL